MSLLCKAGHTSTHFGVVMPEIEEECIFVAKADNIEFTTRTNGDVINISGLNFTDGQAASFAWLINQCGNVVFEAKRQCQ